MLFVSRVIFNLIVFIFNVLKMISKRKKFAVANL